MNEGTRLCVEASPNYLHGGAEIARQIKDLLPGCKLLFSLRDPTARTISYYRSAFGQPHLATFGVGFDQFVSEGIEAAHVETTALDALTHQQREFRHQLTMSCYAGFLRAYIDAFGADRVRIQFFDSIRSDLGKLMRELSHYADIDPAFYTSYEFRVENQTRMHRHVGLRGLAARANYAIEPFLNQFPSVRRAARKLYDAVNVDQSAEIPISTPAVDDLNRFFAPANSDLTALMKAYYPDQPLPEWLSPQTVSA